MTTARDREVAELVNRVEASAATLVLLWDHGLENVEPRISRVQLRALTIVAERESVNLATLADLLGSGTSATSRLVERLFVSGLISRVANPNDRREALLRLSPDGESLLARLRELRRATLANVFAAMPVVSQHALAAGLDAFEAAAARTEAARRRSADGSV